MGYHVRILRRENGSEIPIKKSEIEALVSAMTNLRIEQPRSAAEELYLVITKDGKDISWLPLQQGELWTKNPDQDVLQAMIDVAKLLGARVRGDEFETYRSVNDTYVDPADAEERAKAEQESERLLRPLRRQERRIRLFIILFFLILGIVGFVLGKMLEK